MFTPSNVTRMKKLSAALLGAVIVSTALASAAAPAFALGDCGRNGHRGPLGRSRRSEKRRTMTGRSDS